MSKNDQDSIKDVWNDGWHGKAGVILTVLLIGWFLKWMFWSTEEAPESPEKRTVQPQTELHEPTVPQQHERKVDSMPIFSAKEAMEAFMNLPPKASSFGQVEMLRCESYQERKYQGKMVVKLVRMAQGEDISCYIVPEDDTIRSEFSNMGIDGDTLLFDPSTRRTASLERAIKSGNDVKIEGLFAIRTISKKNGHYTAVTLKPSSYKIVE